MKKTKLPDYHICRILRRPKLAIMKYLFYFIFITAISFVSATTFAQTVTLSERGATLKTLFAKIVKQTGYGYFFIDSLKRHAKPVNIEVSNVLLEEALKIISEGQKFEFKVIGTIITMVPNSFTGPPVKPVLNVKGQVVDEKGVQLPEATLEVDNDHITQTNGNGEFNLGNVSRNSTLKVSHVGYEKELIELKGDTNIRIQMKIGLKELDSVLTDGYHDISKNRFTGSSKKISGNQLNQSADRNIYTRINGLAPGFLLNHTLRKTDIPSVTIRNLATLKATQAPLIILDNFPYDGDINNISIQNIESINILKDASAASLSSVKAGNGVIVIKTKAGRYNQKANISISQNTTFFQKPDLYSAPWISFPDMMQVEQFFFERGFYNESLKNQYSIVSPFVEILNRKQLGLILADDSAASVNSFKKANLRRDLLKYVCRPGIYQEYSFSAFGGSNITNYNLFAGYDKNKGAVPGEEAERFNINLKTMIKLDKNLEVGMSLFYAGNRSSQIDLPTLLSPEGAGKNYPYPSTRLADDYGNPLPIIKAYKSGFTDTISNTQLPNLKFFLQDEIRTNTNKTVSDDIVLNLFSKYTILSWLNIDIKYQLEKTWMNNRSLYGENSFFTRNLIFQFIPPGQPPGLSAVPRGGILDIQQGNLVAQTLRGQVNMNRYFGVHAINAIAGVEVKQLRTSSNTYRTYGYSEQGLTHGYITNQAVPTYFGGEEIIPNPANFGDTVSRFLSFYVNISDKVWDRLTITASARRDGSNLYGVRTNRKFQPLYSLGAAYDLSKDYYFKNSIFAYFNLRASYGFLGNTRNDLAGIFTVREGLNSQLTGMPVYEKGDAPNPDLRAERVSIFNFGADFAVKDRRMFGTLEVYNKNSSDLLSTTRGDLTSGYDIYRANNAQMKGTGIDMELNYKIIDKKEFIWLTTLLASWNTTKITGYPVNLDSAYTFAGSDGSLVPRVGYNPYSITSFRSGGLDQAGNPRGYVNGHLTGNLDSLIANITFNDLDTKPAMPKLFGNVRNTISCNNFSFFVSINYRLFYFFRRYAISYTGLVNNWDPSGGRDFPLRWQKPLDELHTTVPAMGYNSTRDKFYTGSNDVVEDGSNFRLQDIGMNYTFYKSEKKKLPFQTATVYLIVSNVGIIWKAAETPDPDFEIPPPRSISIGAKISF